jgi:hypothetical protein
MKIISRYKDKHNRLLIIWNTRNENLIGEVYDSGIMKRGKSDMRATFYRKDNEATEYRVKEYFGFLGSHKEFV